jgi:hypothetical protein
MKRFWVGFALGVVLTLFVALLLLLLGSRQGGADTVSRLAVRNGRFSPPFPAAASGGDLHVAVGGKLGNDVLFTRGGEVYRFALAKGEYGEHPVCTPDGRSAFVVLLTELDYGSDYSCILRFDFTSAPLGSVQPRRILESSQLSALFPGKLAAFLNLYKVSTDGNRLLLHINRETDPPPGETGTFFTDRPYWYDISGNTLSEPGD